MRRVRRRPSKRWQRPRPELRYAAAMGEASISTIFRSSRCCGCGMRSRSGRSRTWRAHKPPQLVLANRSKFDLSPRTARSRSSTTSISTRCRRRCCRSCTALHVDGASGPGRDGSVLREAASEGLAELQLRTHLLAMLPLSLQHQDAVPVLARAAEVAGDDADKQGRGSPSSRCRMARRRGRRVGSSSSSRALADARGVSARGTGRDRER